MTILVVEDDEKYNKILVDSLSAEGFDMLYAFDGQQAADILKSAKVDLVVSDINLPFVDGFALHKIVKNQYPSTDFILYTSGNADSLTEMTRRLGISKFITNSMSSLNTIKSAVLERVAKAMQENNSVTKRILEQ